MKTVWQDTVIAESDSTVVLESSHYFPRDSIKAAFFERSDKSTYCPWKGAVSFWCRGG
ncbi:MAG: DUF427 domain-containing protein [Congregibacter sp.]